MRLETPLIIPNAEPFLLPGGRTGCLLIHGFTSMPSEMRYLGQYLADQGHTVLGIRLAGHATYPRDLKHTRWTDWLISVEDGLAILNPLTDRTFVIGLSMGGNIALLAAAQYPTAGVAAMSTPYQGFPWQTLLRLHMLGWLRPVIRKGQRDVSSPWADRREATYPAYPQFPASILLEVARLQAAMRRALPFVRAPALLVHSRQDAAIPPTAMQQIHDRLGSADKQTLWLDNFDHAVVRDSRRQMVFDAIAGFIAELDAKSP